MHKSNPVLRVVRLFAGVIAFGIQFPDPALAAEAAENVIEAFDVYADGDMLLLPVTINRQQYSFVVDTGSTGNFVDAAKTPALPLLGKRERVNGGDEHPLCSLRGAFFGKSRIPTGAEAIQIDLSGIRKACGYDICGVLGMSCLWTHILEIDFDRGRLSFLKSVPDSAGSAFRLFRDRLERPMLSIDVSEDDSIPFMVDTGFCGVGITAKLRKGRFELLYEQGLIELLDGDVHSVKFEGYSHVRRGCLSTLALGDTTHRRIGVCEGNQSALGLCFLSRYVVTFDFPNQQLYLKPGKRISEPDRLNMSGVGVWRSVAEGVEIALVDPNSPGSAAGLKAGDQILKFDGKDASSISLFKLRTLLATESLRIKLEVENSAGRREVTLELMRPKKAPTQKAP